MLVNASLFQDNFLSKGLVLVESPFPAASWITVKLAKAFYDKILEVFTCLLFCNLLVSALLWQDG